MVENVEGILHGPNGVNTVKTPDIFKWVVSKLAQIISSNIKVL